MSFSGTKGYLTKPRPGVMLNPLHPLSQGLVGCWLFNEGAGSRANDISGCGNHGRLKNISPNAQGSGWSGSQFGGGLQLDGVNDCIDCGNDESLNITDAITIEAWVKWMGNNGHIISKYTGAYNRIELFFGSSYVVISVGNGTASADGKYTFLPMMNEWYHLVGTYDGTDIKLYKNSVMGEISESINTIATINANVIIGGRTTGNFNGSIDKVRIYNRVLSAEEIKQLYQAPFCNLLQVPIRRPFSPTIMNQFQTYNIGADLYQGAIIA